LGLAAMLKIYVVDGTEEIQSFEFRKDTIHIGRSSDNDIKMKDEYVSRRHLKVFKREGKYFLQDLSSSNGTFVNGLQVAPGAEVEVKEGAPITVGMSLICLGKTCLEQIIPFVDSILDSEELTELGAVSVQDRALTHKNNMELIYNVSNVLKSSMTLKEIMESILDYIFGLLRRIDRGVIILIDKNTGKVTETFPRQNPNTEQAAFSSYSKTIVDRVVKEAKGLMMLDTYDEDSSNLSESIKLMKIRSVLCVPLISKGDIRGVIYLDSISKPYGFRSEDLSLLTALSSSAAMVIENALLSSAKETASARP
jgi:sigma-B regulation protein RsbU (phosphoserine phosphatase)